MRTLMRLVAVAAAAATVTAMAVVPAAMADPPSGVTPKPADIVGVGSDTTENVLDQFSVDFNKGLSASAPHLYSYNATNPVTGAIGDTIPLKSGCTGIARPDGSSAGITALVDEEGATTKGHPCLDFARSARNRKSTDPAYAKGGLAFITLAGDAITYATQPGSAAPGNLTTAQLTAIYTCADTNWSQVGGKDAPIHAFLPQEGSGIRSSFLTAIGVTTPGPCVSWGQTSKNPNGILQENEGISPLLNKDKPDIIFPYAVSKYLAQVYRDAKCLRAKCIAETSGPDTGLVCKPSATQNEFGCNEHGTLVLNEINGTTPTNPWPLTSKTTSAHINPKFTPAFTISQYIVVPYSTAKGNVNHIPPYLLPLFGPGGFACTNKTAKKDLADYGFRVFGDGGRSGHSTIKCGDTH
jgi:ABC-type phosphate transport system substrate-binding protein